MLIIGAGATIDLIILPPLREACRACDMCVAMLLLAGVGAFKPPCAHSSTLPPATEASWVQIENPPLCQLSSSSCQRVTGHSQKIRRWEVLLVFGSMLNE